MPRITPKRLRAYVETGYLGTDEASHKQQSRQRIMSNPMSYHMQGSNGAHMPPTWDQVWKRCEESCAVASYDEQERRIEWIDGGDEVFSNTHDAMNAIALMESDSADAIIDLLNDTTLDLPPVADGVYFLHPEGSLWIAAEFRGGQCVDRTEESNAATHAAARDSWADVVPSDDDSEVTDGIAEAIVYHVMGDEVDASMVVVTKR